MAALDTPYASSVTVQSNSSVVPVTELSIAGTEFTANTEYLVIARALVRSPSTVDKVACRVRSIDDASLTARSEQVVEVENVGSNDFYPYYFLGTFTTDASPGALELQLWSPDGGGSTTVEMTNMVLHCFNLDELKGDAYKDGDGNGTLLPLYGGTGTQEQLAAEYTPTTDHEINDVWLPLGLSSSYPTDNVVLEIRDGSETGTLLGTSDAVDASGIRNNLLQPIWPGTRFHFSTPVTTQGQCYLVLRRTGARSVTQYVRWEYTDDAAYSTGRQRDNGTWGNAADAMLYRINEPGIWINEWATGGTEFPDNVVGTPRIQVPASVLADDEYVILGYQRVGVGSTGRWYEVFMSIPNSSGNGYQVGGKTREEGEDTGEYRMVGFQAVYAGDHTGTDDLEIYGWEEAANGNMMDEGGALVLLKSTLFASVEWSYTASNTDSGSTPHIQTSIAEYTPPTDGDHLLLGRLELDPDVAGNTDRVWIDVDDGTDVLADDDVEYIRQVWDSTKSVPHGIVVGQYTNTGTIGADLVVQIVGIYSRTYGDAWLIDILLNEPGGGGPRSFPRRQLTTVRM